MSEPDTDREVVRLEPATPVEPYSPEIVLISDDSAASPAPQQDAAATPDAPDLDTPDLDPSDLETTDLETTDVVDPTDVAPEPTAAHAGGWRPPAGSRRAARGDADRPKAWSGRPLASITIEAAREGDLIADDLRIHPDGLLRQAAVAETAGNPQLAANFALAAELAVLPDKELLSLYDLLRPGRASLDAMNEAVRLLERLELPRAAELVREAANWYTARGLIG